MEARQAQAADWETLRQLRLRALADAPDAFASTLEAEVASPDEVWRQRAEGGPASATVIAREGGVDVGLVGSSLSPTFLDACTLYRCGSTRTTGDGVWPVPWSLRPCAGRPNAEPAR